MFYFSGIFIVVFLPKPIIYTVLKSYLDKYGFYQDLLDASVLLLMINVWINPLYYFYKLKNIRKGLVDVFMCAT